MGEGAKLMEWGYGSGTMLTALAILLAVSNGRGGGDYHSNETDSSLDEWVGRWGGDCIAVVGDYAEDTDLAPEHHASAIWTACGNARDGETRSLEERIAENESKRPQYGDYVDGWNERERAVELIDPPYRNISAEMRRVIQADGVIRFDVEEYRTRHFDGTVTTSEHVKAVDVYAEQQQKHLRPDMVITTGD
jgi:hypothetical protein